MRRALRLAERGWGRVAPNPMVGAVLVRDGVIVGEGYHAEFGGPHAEVVALERAGERARGSTLYVTLEPCSRQGKTPPCAEAILRAGVSRVVYAATDPTEAGGGCERLRAAGVETAPGPCEQEARDLLAPFLTAALERRTFVALKLALSLDARIAEAPGRPTAITGPRALQEAHRLRAGHDAVAVGVGTVLSDDPLLTVREAARPRRPPVRIVLDARLRAPATARLVRTAGEAPLWILTGYSPDRRRAAELEAAGARVLPLPEAHPGRLDLPASLDRLWQEGLQSVLFEGGAEVATQLLREDLVDRLYLFYAPLLLGARGLSAFAAEGARRWRVLARRALGRDTLLTLGRT